MGMDKGSGVCQVVTRDLRSSSSVCTVYDPRRSRNVYYPDFAYRVDGKRKQLQVLSVVGPTKFVQGSVEGASCFTRLRAEGETKCIEAYGQSLGYRPCSEATPSTFHLPAVFECKIPERDEKVGQEVKLGQDVRWVNPFPFDSGAEELVMSLARHASEWIAFFQKNISKLNPLKPSLDHTKLSLVLQLDVINCEAWSECVRRPLKRLGCDSFKSQGPSKKFKGVRYRTDRNKWVAEFNPSGKKNNKISLGEYDTEAEAARAADAGMFRYGSKRGSHPGSYNFEDSQSRLAQLTPPPGADDKEAVRKWARDFAKLPKDPSKPSFSSVPSMSSVSFGSAMSFGHHEFDISSSLQQMSPTPFSSIPQVYPRVSVLDYTGNLRTYDSDSSSSLSFSLGEVANYMKCQDTSDCFEELDQGSTPMISNRYTSVCLEELDQESTPMMTNRYSSVSLEELDEGSSHMIPSTDTPICLEELDQGSTDMIVSLPTDQNVGYPVESMFRNDADFWMTPPPIPGSPAVQNTLSRTTSDGRMSDDLFQWYGTVSSI